MNTKLTKAYKDLFSDDFQQMIAETADAIILDVRTSDEFRSGRIPAAINIDVMDHSFFDKIASLNNSETYFVYCRSGARSAQACNILSFRGFKVYNLAGGILNWKGKII